MRKYLSYLIILTVIVLVGWSASVSVNLTFSKEHSLSYYMSKAIVSSVTKYKNNLVQSLAEAIIKDLKS